MPRIVIEYTDTEKTLAQFLVDKAGLMGPSPDGSRLSSGHNWPRRHPEDEKFFLELAARMLDEAQSDAYEHYHPRED